MSRTHMALSLSAVFLLAGCTGGADESVEMEMEAEMEMEMPPAAEMGPRSVTIASPQDGATITGTTIPVVLQVSGVRVVEAGVFDPGTGHHHLFLDVDPTPMDAVIPAGQPGIVHLGLAQTEYVFEGVTPGTHRIITVMADGGHIPLSPPVADTIMVTVVAPNP